MHIGNICRPTTSAGAFALSCLTKQTEPEGRISMADPTPLEPPNQTTQCEQQHLLLTQPPPSGFTPNWVGAFVTTLMVILGYLTGPTVLLSWRIKERAACSIWDADERQRSMRGSVLLYLLFYIPIILFRSQIAQLWTFIFSHLSLLLH